MTYGVIPEGFSRKPLATILAELEDAMIATFGPEVVQSAESPFGQLNGLHSNLAETLWEVGEDVYQSLDPDQAEGVRLDMLGRIRGVDRPDGEVDTDYRRRITNESRSTISLRPLIEAVEAVTGVECANVWVNDTDAADVNGIPGHSLAVAVIGGTDEAVAAAIHAETVPGVGLYGNATVSIADGVGLCRSVSILRPTEIRVTLEVTISETPPSCACRVSTVAEVRNAISGALACGASCGLRNGDDVVANAIIRALAGLDGANVLSVRGAIYDAAFAALPVVIAFDEIASIDPADITVIYA